MREILAYFHMLAAPLGTIHFEVTPNKIHNDLTIQQLTTGFAIQGQKFYINIFYNSCNNSSSDMMNTYLAKQLPIQMAVEQKSKEVNIKNINKEGIHIVPTRQPQKFLPINFTFYCYLFT